MNLQTVITNSIPNMALAAEYKRASPSKGMIASQDKHMDAAAQAIQYTIGGCEYYFLFDRTTILSWDVTRFDQYTYRHTTTMSTKEQTTIHQQ